MCEGLIIESKNGLVVGSWTDPQVSVFDDHGMSWTMESTLDYLTLCTFSFQTNISKRSVSTNKQVQGAQAQSHRQGGNKITANIQAGSKSWNIKWIQLCTAKWMEPPALTPFTQEAWNRMGQTAAAVQEFHILIN